MGERGGRAKKSIKSAKKVCVFDAGSSSGCPPSAARGPKKRRGMESGIEVGW